MTKTPVPEPAPPAVPAVGIDLGTTYSVIAHLDAQGRPRTLPSAEGDLTTPSVLLFERDNVVVGKEAVKAAATEPDCVAECVKREMGAAAYSRAIRGQFLPPEVVQSFLLRKLRTDAELTLGRFSQVVITVPAYFNEPRRKATQDTARLAGLETLDIINEPTAAAIAYGVQQGFLGERGLARAREKVLVYDLGGGTFDVTLMELDGDHYTTLATAGDVYLGGIDWDRRIVDWIAEQFLARHGGPDPRQDAAAWHRLMQEAEDAKRALSARQEVQVKFEFHDHAWRAPLSRAALEDLTRDLLERTRFTIRQLLADAQLGWSDVTRLLLTGGSTRMPMIQEMLRDESGLPVDRSLSADEAVAHGAAIYAGYLLARDQGASIPQLVSQVTNVNSHPLGVLGVEPATGRPRCRVLIPRNTPLPATRRGQFATRRESQESVVVNVVEGGDASGQNAAHIGRCVVANLPPGLPAHTPVVVSFHYLQNGRLEVQAELPGTDCQAALTIERAAGLSPEMLAEWEQALEQGLQFDEPPEAAAEPVEGGFEFDQVETLPVDAPPSETPVAWSESEEETQPGEAGSAWEFAEPAAESPPEDDDLDEFLKFLK
jgi:molecular chaperone DnaK